MSDDDRILKSKVCLIGDPQVGKTSLIRRYVHDEFDDRYVSTLGAKITKKELTVPTKNGDYRVNMIVWDIVGERRLTDLLKDCYFDGAGGLLAVCDLTREDTFEGLNEWITTANSVIETPPMAFVGNKIDLKDETVFGGSQLSSFACEYDAPCFLTSAKTGENVNAAFLELGKRVVAEMQESNR